MPKTNARARRSTGRERTQTKPKRSARVAAPPAHKHPRVPRKPIKATRAKPILDLGKVYDKIGDRVSPLWRVSFVRPDDLFVCDFLLGNLKLGGDKLVRADPAHAATLILELPPQSFGERAFLDATGPEVTSNPPAGSKEAFQEIPGQPAQNKAGAAEGHAAQLPFAGIRMAGRSRIAFTMPAAEASLDFTATAILDACRRWPMQLDVNAAKEPDNIDRVFPSRSKLSAAFDKNWLHDLTASPAWTDGLQMLVDAFDGAAYQPQLQAAAERLATQAATALNAHQTRGLATALNRAMTKELDALAVDHPPLGEGPSREFAAAALSLAASQAFAVSRVDKFGVGVVKHVPFLPVFLAPHKPARTDTALELPYRLILSPIPPSNWWHATQLVEHNGRTELWHTRLTQTQDGKGPDAGTKVRALWSPDYPLDAVQIANISPPAPFRMSLDALDRQMLVDLMANYFSQDIDEEPFVPRPAAAHRLMLSALGALIDTEGSWDQLPQGVGLEQWRHLASLGRDAYVRVVYRGFLCPFGHAASLIKVTERKFEDMVSKNPPDHGKRVALLRQRFFIVVREPSRTYNGAGHEFQGRNFPFTSVEILTRVTPSLRAPDLCTMTEDPAIYTGPVPKRACFWPMLSAASDFVFRVRATDLSGDQVTFAMPLLFVGKEANDTGKQANPAPNPLERILSAYSPADETLASDKNKTRRTTALAKASVCYAPLKPGGPDDKGGDPRLPTQSIRFRAAGVKGIKASKVQFYPEIEKAEVGIASIQRLLGKPDAMVNVSYPKAYKENGFDNNINAGEVFLKMPAFNLGFGSDTKSDTLGGLATPSMAIQGLSRVMGPVAAKPPANQNDLDAVENALGNVLKNTFDPTDFFKGAEILGGISLADLLETVFALAGADVPKLLSAQLPDKVEARFDWETEIKKSDPLGLFVPKAGGNSVLKMHGVVTTPIANPADTKFEANASLVCFKVNLFGFIIIWFDKIAFTSKTGAKPDVSVDMHSTDTVMFGGPLEFVNKLKDIIPSNGFGDGSGIDVTPAGIGANFSLSIPDISVGMFALTNMALGAGFELPFDAKPAQVRFNFCERQSMFGLQVWLLGGGGFFAIGISTKGVNEIEAALEFGAGISINLGVASGMVEIKAGIYYHWQTASVELSGYIRLHGELSILGGLISASLTFNLSLSYLKEGGKSVVWGEATLTVEVEVLFFSFDVSVKCRREFGGSDSDPTFKMLIPGDQIWKDYCGAFAEEAY